MATLLLTALGSAIGGPVGGAIGSLIGHSIDGRIFGPHGREGPRLRDLAVSTSSYGQAIPRQFGRMRVPGTVIWSTDLIESKHKQRAKGQPTTTVYAYAASFAVALSSTPIARVGRIWADGNLLRGAQEDLKVGGAVRIYNGFGDDPVDPLIAAAEGEQAPAFRHCAYVVFDNLELADFGNRIPALSFEIFAHGGEETVSLAQLIPAPALSADMTPLVHARGFADEGGSLASTLATIDAVIPLVCTSGSDGFVIAPRQTAGEDVLTLPAQLAADDSKQDEPRQVQRAGMPARTPSALRYYDEERDYQTGVQRAGGARQEGRELMIDLPATLTAGGARQLAGASANRSRWQHETVTWRIGELDPRITPGTIVRLPDMPGQWLLKSWEWCDRGVALELERLAPTIAPARTADAGASLAPPDLIVPTSQLAALEVPPDGSADPAKPLIFAAASGANRAWRGAALYAVQGSALIDLGTTGKQRAVMGHLAEPLEGSLALMFEPRGEAVVALAADDLSLFDTDMGGLVAGANRMLVGGELIQFMRAVPLGAARWRLSGLLRGRAGTEPAAMAGHPAGTGAVLIEDTLVALDPMLVPPLAVTRVAAIGTNDPEPVLADLVNAGLSRRPPCPVHPRTCTEAGGTVVYRWTRRARGQWRWPDRVEVPLVEEREAYVVGFGPTGAPRAFWPCEDPSLRLTVDERAALVADFGPGLLWVRQIGTFDQSPPLALASLS